MNQKLKPQIRKLQKNIDHIVVLMLENRSFDNFLGWLYDKEKPPHRQEYDGLTWDLWNPLDNIDTDGIPFVEKVAIEKNGMYKESYGKEIPNPDNFALPDPDPGEGFKDTNHQLFQQYNVAELYPPPPTNMGFVQNYHNAMLYGAFSFGDDPTNPRNIMKCYTPEQTPVLSELARSFAVLDQYHCSVPSQTLPNRDFVHAATSTGFVNNKPTAMCDAKTIFNQIQDAIEEGRDELTWGIFGDNPLGSSSNQPGHIGKDHFSLTRLIMTRLHDEKFNDNFGTLKQFKAKCKKGNLPSYSFLEPIYHGEDQNDQHPPTDIRKGEKLIADIYNMVKDSPVFDKTMLIITYDEHGGCYDHVAPPGGATPPDPNNPVGQDGFRFNRFGVRVPCVVVSPYIKKGLIGRTEGYTPFDHTSIIKTIQNCFKLKGSLTERDAAAPDFSCLLTLKTPRKAKDFPKVKPLKWDTKAAEKHINDLHHVMGDVLEELTGEKKPNSNDIFEFIQLNYSKFFGGE